MSNSFGKVAVLMGGWSAEREISLISGRAVLDALVRKGVDAHAVDVGRNACQQLQGFDRAFNILHGRGGEDGEIQGLMEVMQLPYTGSGVLGSAIAMDKLLTKKLWQASALPTPDYSVVNSLDDCYAAVKVLGLPCMMKPVLEGSSIGISKIVNKDGIDAAWQLASQCSGSVIVEAFVDGGEYTAAILGDRVLPMIRLGTPNEFYDYEAKYQSDDTQYECPCGLPEDQEQELAVLVQDAFNAAHANGWGRVDFMLDKNDQPWLIEVNTTPGMTSHSLVPMAAKQAGIDFDELVIEILRGSLA